MKAIFAAIIALGISLSAAAQDNATPFKLLPPELQDALKRTLLEEPVKLTLGLDADSGGLAATAKGDYITAVGKAGRFTRGYMYGVDGVWNSTANELDQVEFSAGYGFVELNAGYPRWSGFARVLGKNGQFKGSQDGDAVNNVNQLLAGVTFEYVHPAWSDWVLARVLIPAESYPNTPCTTLPPDQRKTIGCKPPKKGRTIEVPPRITFSYYHPVRTDGPEGTALPEKIDAGKLAVGFDLDNEVYAGSGAIPPVRALMNLAATLPTSGDDKDLNVKADVGVGFVISDKYTVAVKYVAGEKDGFEYDRAVLIGVLVDFAKTLFK